MAPALNMSFEKEATDSWKLLENFPPSPDF